MSDILRFANAIMLLPPRNPKWFSRLNPNNHKVSPRSSSQHQVFFPSPGTLNALPGLTLKVIKSALGVLPST
eukprot:825193-Heterocapsa_arctica.AAC.1